VSIYKTKQKWKLALFALAVMIGLSSILITNLLVDKLATEERKKMEIWAEANREIGNMESEIEDFSFFLRIIQENETVPVIVVDDNEKILLHHNLNPSRSANHEYLERRLASMKKQNSPIEIEIMEDISQFIYFGDSSILVWLGWYPYIQLGVILLFLIAAYYAFSISRKAEQNQVWLGMSKETAHQLATPTSSLMAWLEIMKEKDQDIVMINELEKDIRRLEKITSRFSRIGSKPRLKDENVIAVIDNAIEYIRIRAPRTVVFEKGYITGEPVNVPVNAPLFDWVIENLCKNALDAMEGGGKISVTLEQQERTVNIDITDTGKGIPRNLVKTIFKPGFTTRRNGWGLGLSLSKRIIEQYHHGKIFVLHSIPGQGTTIRIVLNRTASKSSVS
jgi:nitrogen-specific signal transduction histidine kinase